MRRCQRCDEDLNLTTEKLGGLCSRCLEGVRLLSEREFEQMLGREKGTMLGGD